VTAAAPPAARTRPAAPHRVLVGAACALPLLALASLFVGVADLSPAALLRLDGDAWHLVAISRGPRTLALVLAGASTAVVGTIMQMIARNRFAEPSTTGTVEFAVLGLLVVTLVAPGLPVAGRIVAATAFALAGTAVFLAILRRVPLRSPLVVPLVGIVLGGVVAAVSTFVAYRTDLLQALASWSTGDFSGILQGRYETLWVAGALAVVAYVVADRFTVAGLGEAFTTNLGLSYRRTVTLGLVVVSVVSAVVVVTVGIVPFLGLVVPNVVSLLRGDDVRRALPWVATLGAFVVLACDLVGRLVRYPYEIPIGVVVGVVGSVLFLWLLLRADAGGARVG
jgi:iron complex transport system permease protein